MQKERAGPAFAEGYGGALRPRSQHESAPVTLAAGE
jgi:hypothetical protein